MTRQKVSDQGALISAGERLKGDMDDVKIIGLIEDARRRSDLARQLGRIGQAQRHVVRAVIALSEEALQGIRAAQIAQVALDLLKVLRCRHCEIILC
jgi:hypothetical protein